MSTRWWFGALVGVISLAAAGPAGAQTVCGPVILAGHDADDHGFEMVYAGLFDEIANKVTNGGTGILALGADEFDDAGIWIQTVASLMTPPQTVTYVNDGAITTTSFNGFAILHVPSDLRDTFGGISDAENNLLSNRATDVAAFVNGGGGLFGLTQGQLPDAWQYIALVGTFEHRDVPPGGTLPSGDNFDDVTATLEGNQLGITDTNVDGCCFHNVFTVFPAFLRVLAVANEPLDPDFNGIPVFIGGISTCLAPRCGDGVVDPGEECDDGNNTNGDGCSSVCKREVVSANLPPVGVCAPCEVCAAPGLCSVPGDCGPGTAVCLDPETGPINPVCAPPGPYPVGTTQVEVTCSDGKTDIKLNCPVTVKDCEPPKCTAPAPLQLECSSPCGTPSTDPLVQAWLAGVNGSDNCAVDRINSYPPPMLTKTCANSPAVVFNQIPFQVIDRAQYQNMCLGVVTVLDSQPPVVTAPPPLVLECDRPGGIPLNDPRIQGWLNSAKATDVCSDATVTHDAPAVFPSACAPTGAVTKVKFTGTDGCGYQTTVESTVTVVDSQGPVIQACGIRELCLWPPDHRYVCFENASTLVQASDLCDGSKGGVAAIECVSDQCDDAPCSAHPGENGDGSTTNDCYWDPATDRLCARAERAGTEKGGRHYSVTFVATDSCGNGRREVGLQLYVPHDQSPHMSCMSAAPAGDK